MVEHLPHFRFKDTTKNPICKRFLQKPSKNHYLGWKIKPFVL